MSRQHDPLPAAEAGESTALLRHTVAFTSNSWPAQSHSVAELWRHGYKSPEELDTISNHAVRDFYERQNDLLERFRQVSSYHIQPIDNGIDAHERAVRRAIVASNVSNTVLMACQLYAFMSSRSLALLAVFLDAVLDMVSGLVILLTWYMKRRRDKHRYPVGRSRLEPLGVIGMACLMTAATLITLERSISALARGKHSAPLEGLTYTSATVLLSALCIKGTLYIYCSRIEDTSVKALAEDHFNDCVANSVSFCTVLVAQHFLWWVDPLGGILVSCLIIHNWVLHTLGHVDQLLGKAADREVLNLITFVACNHDSHILLVDTVRAYHVGNGIYVEVDIALPAQMPLREAHDVGESLQTRIETLHEVERCFVHLDFETSHSPDTEHKQI
ncbi:unnamed protein product [Agarophyton chilense]|eukprot:gb/GEZJ01002425.1/.p2 GENE.gb/GEZJ01002425.1/~~gb/GEZJ01002425.1/.p2  ORF type:complete len:388 (+),score=54.54 gb/GEZJ01002425.1/:2704-3867(+)